jgi:5'-deoxynucleotidase
MHHFFAYLFRMKNIKRWGLMRSLREEDLEQHSLEVAVLAHALALIRRDVFGHAECSPEHVAVTAMFHDAAEILTGDMPTPVKYMTSGFTGAYREIEKNANTTLLGFLPESLRPEYEKLFDHEADAQTYRLVKAADRLAAYIKCVDELSAGNTEFALAARQTKASLDAMQMPELDYFRETFLPSFSLTLDEM